MSADHSESSPLLPPVDERHEDAGDNKPKLSRAARITIGVSSLLLLFAVEIGAFLLSTPFVQVEESIICRKKFPDVIVGSDDRRCKDNKVQSELSMLQAVETSCGLLPGLITAVPWGVVADKYGRLFVLRLTMLGIVLSTGANIIIFRFPDLFPIKLVWLTPVFMVIGGGASMASAMVYTVASDISSQAQRSTAFFILAAVAMTANLLSKPITYLAMENGAWFAIAIGYMILLLCWLSVFILPPLLTRLAYFSLPPAEPERAEEVDAKDGPLDALRHHVASGTAQIKESFRFLFLENKGLGLIMLSIMLTTLGKDADVVLMQYITKRFSWSWSQANLLLSISSFIKLGLFALILPAISQFLLVKTGLSSFAKDAWISEGSLALLIVGAFAIGLATSPASLVFGISISALGSPFNLSARSLLATMAKENHVAMLYTTITFVELSGIFIASPVLATSFRIGLELGGGWIGLPFLSAGCLFFLAAIAFVGAGLSETEEEEEISQSRYNNSDGRDN